MTTLLAPNACQTMTDLRAQIDTIDIELINLLVTRSRYIDRAVALSADLPCKLPAGKWYVALP